MAKQIRHARLPSGQGAGASCSRRASASRRCSSRSSTTRCPAATARRWRPPSVKPLGQPEIEVTKKEYGEDLTFTAEVDVRPEIDLPDLAALKITVDPIEVTDDEVDAELQNAAGAVRHADRCRARGRRTATSSRSTCRPPSTARTCPRPRPRACRTRSARASSSRASTTRSSGLKADETKVLHHHAGRRRARRQGGPGHRHRQVGQGARAARGRRRIRPTGKRIRHHRRAQGEPRRAGAPRQAHPAGRADPRQGAGGAARAGRGAAARGDRARRRSTTPCTTRSTASTTTRTKFAEALVEEGSTREEFDADNRHQRREGRQDPAADGRDRRRAGHPGRPERPHRAAGADVAAVRHRAAAAAAGAAAEQPAARRCSPTCAAGWPSPRWCTAPTVTDTDGNEIDTDRVLRSADAADEASDAGRRTIDVADGRRRRRPTDDDA